jgi:hypothetical protein
MRRAGILVVGIALATSGCAVPPPTGPSVMALPAQGKSFAEFQHDDASCRNYASMQIGGASPAQAAQESGISSAALGTLLGAAAGAALGAVGGNAGAGAAIGAGTGLVFGGASGIGASQYSGASLQHRYDMGYLQCMAAAGESVPTQSSQASGYYGHPYAYPYPYYGGYYRPYY